MFCPLFIAESWTDIDDLLGPASLNQATLWVGILDKKWLRSLSAISMPNVSRRLIWWNGSVILLSMVIVRRYFMANSSQELIIDIFPAVAAKITPTDHKALAVAVKKRLKE